MKIYLNLLVTSTCFFVGSVEAATGDVADDPEADRPRLRGGGDDDDVLRRLAKPVRGESTGRVIMKIMPSKKLRKEGKSDSEIKNIRKQAKAEIKKNKIVLESNSKLGASEGFEVVEVGKGKEKSFIDKMIKKGLFEFVEEDKLQVLDVTSPNDSLLSTQWHHNNMQSREAWDLSTGSASVTVAICDTGIDMTHPDLTANRLEGYDAVNQLWESEGGNISDDDGHGTSCAGCAAAIGNNAVGVTGMGWNFKHRPGRVTAPGGGAYNSVLADCAMKMCELPDVKVVGVSYSGPESLSRKAAATYCKSQGALMVNAAGNDNRDLTIYGRADDDDLIVVGATTNTDAKSSFSAYGKYVDVWAPGSSVFTTNIGGVYHSVYGTSFSCPLTAGLIALIFSYNPSLTPDQVELVLKQGTELKGAIGANPSPHGRINSFRSLQRAISDTPFPSQAPTTDSPSRAPAPAEPVEPTITATYDGICPKCTQVGGACSSGTLLDSRGLMPPTAESNGAQNSIDSCTDGSAGVYHSDESNDAIEVSAVGGGFLKIGRQAIIKATVWAYDDGSEDIANFYVSESVTNPNWVFVGSGSPQGGQAQVLLSPPFDITSTLMAVRVNFGYIDVRIPGSSCSGGDFDDVDDLAFVTLPAGPTSPTTSVPSSKPTNAPTKAPISFSCSAYDTSHEVTSGNNVYWTGTGGDSEWINKDNWLAGFLPGIDNYNKVIMDGDDAATVNCDATYMAAGIAIEVRSGATLSATANLNIGEFFFVKTTAAVIQTSTSQFIIGKNLYMYTNTDWTLTDQAALSIGLDLILNLNAELTINGDGTTITASNVTPTQTKIHGHVKYVFGPTGTGIFDVQGELLIGSFATLVIDASSYTGGGGSIPLIKYTLLAAGSEFSAANIDISGLAAELSPTLNYASDGLYLELAGGTPSTAAPTPNPTPASVTPQPTNFATPLPTPAPTNDPTPSPTTANPTSACITYDTSHEVTSSGNVYWSNTTEDSEWINKDNWLAGFLPGIDNYNKVIMDVNDHATVNCDATYMAAGIAIEVRSGATLSATANLNIGEAFLVKTNAAVMQTSTSQFIIGKNLYMFSAAYWTLTDQAALSIGLDLILNFNAELTINGDGTTITASNVTPTQTQIHGHVKYVFGPTGTGIFDVQGELLIGSFATLVIDASSYTGGGGSVPLIKYTLLAAGSEFSAANIDVSGLAAELSPTLNYASDGLYLELAETPQPTPNPTEAQTPQPTNDPTPQPTSFPNSPPIIATPKPTNQPVSGSVTRIVLDVDGVAPITSTGTCPPPEDSLVIIDGEEYAAGPGVLTLYDCTFINANYDLLKYRLENFAEGLWFEIAYKSDSIDLVIKSLANYRDYHKLIQRNFEHEAGEYPESTEQERLRFPSFSWNHIPTWVRYYKNKSPLTDDELATIATHQISWLGINTPTYIQDNLGAIKGKNETHKTLYYWNAESYWGGWGPSTPGFPAANGGEAWFDCCKFGTNGRRLWEWTVAAFRTWWLERPKTMIAESNGNIDGVMTDNTMNECKSNNWKLAINTCDHRNTHKATAIRQLALDLNTEHNALDIGNYLRQNFNDGNRFRMHYADGSYFENQHKGYALQNDQAPHEAIVVSMQMAREASWKKKIVMWTGSRSNCNCGYENPGWNDTLTPDECKPFAKIPEGVTPAPELFREPLLKSLGEFLVIVEEFSYFNFNVGVQADCGRWRWDSSSMGLDEFDRPLGRPLGPPVKSGHTFSRHFEHVSVKYDTASETTWLIWDA